jgi:hypothetical protein
MSNGPGGTDVVSAGDRAVREPADRALGYGRRAAAHGVRVAEGPGKKPVKKKLDHVAIAKKQWDRLFPTSPIEITDLTDYPIKAVIDRRFDAWTNSPTEICVAYSAIEPPFPAKLIGVLHHESLHVDQFVVSSGKPPASYFEMVKFECDAYSDSAIWLRAHNGTADMDAVAGAMQDQAKKFCAKRDQVLKLRDPKVRERKCQQFLGFGQHKGGIQSLYRRP